MSTYNNSWSAHLRQTFVLGLPLIGSHVAQMLTHITDVIMLGWYSVDALAAVVLAAQVFFIIFIVGSGFAFAVMPLVAEAFGSAQDNNARRATRMGGWISLGWAAIFTPILMATDPILRAFGQDPDLSAIAGDYMQIAGWGLLPALLIMVFKSFLSALERANIVLIATLGAAVANVGFNYALIFGNWGFPEMGAQGAAVASVLTTTLSFGVLVAYILIHPAVKRYTLFQNLTRADWPALRHVFLLGWPIGLTLLAETGLFAAATLMVGWTDTVTLAAHGIVLQIASVSFMIPLGLSNVATIRAGNALGRKDELGLRRVAIVTYAAALVVALCAMVLFVALPEPLIRLFMKPDEPAVGQVLLIGTGLLFVAAMFQLADSGQVIVLGLLRGVQETTWPMWITVVAYWGIGMPVAYGLGFGLDMGASGIWWGLVFGLAAAWAGLIWRWLAIAPGIMQRHAT